MIVFRSSVPTPALAVLACVSLLGCPGENGEDDDADYYLLELSLAGDGSGSVDVDTGFGAETCSAAKCSYEVFPDSSVFLLATPAADSTFAGFSDRCADGKVVMNVDLVRCTATFDLRDPLVNPRSLTVDIAGEGKGHVTSSPGGIDCTDEGGTCEAAFEDGVVVALTAEAAAGSVLDSWTGDSSDGTVTMDGDKTVTAAFAPRDDVQSRLLQVVVRGDGEVESDPPGIACSSAEGDGCRASFPMSTVVRLEASPEGRFVFWEGDCDGDSAAESVTLDEDARCVANFRSRRRGDAVMLSDLQYVYRHEGGYWSFSAISVSANVILADADTSAAFTEISDNLLVFQDVPYWGSEQGLGEISLASGAQAAVATYADGRYVIEGLVPGPAFSDDDDSLTVTAEGDDGPVEVVVPTPPSPAVELLGEPAGLSTELHVRDGDFDLLYVFTLTADYSSGVMQFIPAEDMTLEDDGAGGMQRTTTLLSQEAQDALSDAGLEVAYLYVAYFNEEESAALFPGLRPVPVQAGRMFFFDGAFLQ